MLLAISLFCLTISFASFIPSIRSRTETFAPIYFLAFSLASFSYCLHQATVPIGYALVSLALLVCAYLILPVAKTKPKLLLLLSFSLASSPFLMYGASFDYFGFKVLFTTNGVVFLSLLTWTLIVSTDFILPLLAKRFFCNDGKQIEAIVFVSIIAITGGIGFFFGQYFGLFIVAFGALLAVHTGRNRDYLFAYSTIAGLLICTIHFWPIAYGNVWSDCVSAYF
jgi:hypothetical protein